MNDDNLLRIKNFHARIYMFMHTAHGVGNKEADSFIPAHRKKYHIYICIYMDNDLTTSDSLVSKLNLLVRAELHLFQLHALRGHRALWDRGVQLGQEASTQPLGLVDL